MKNSRFVNPYVEWRSTVSVPEHRIDLVLPHRHPLRQLAPDLLGRGRGPLARWTEAEAEAEAEATAMDNDEGDGQISEGLFINEYGPCPIYWRL